MTTEIAGYCGNCGKEAMFAVGPGTLIGPNGWTEVLFENGERGVLCGDCSPGVSVRVLENYNTFPLNEDAAASDDASPDPEKTHD